MQQICQLNISFTLLVAIVIRFKEQSDPMTLHNTENTMAWLLLGLTIFSAFSAFVLSFEEAAGDGIQIKKNKQRAFKAARALRKRYMRNIVFVTPKSAHGDSLTTSMLIAEELGGVPYAGKADVTSFLQGLHEKAELSLCKEWSMIPAQDEHSIYARVKYAGTWWMATIPLAKLTTSEKPSAWIELGNNPRFSRSRPSLLSVVSDATLLASMSACTAQNPSCASVSSFAGERQEASVSPASMNPQSLQTNESGSLAESAGPAYRKGDTFVLSQVTLPPPLPAAELPSPSAVSPMQTPAALGAVSPINSLRTRFDGMFSSRRSGKDSITPTQDGAPMADVEMADQSKSSVGLSLVA